MGSCWCQGPEHTCGGQPIQPNRNGRGPSKPGGSAGCFTALLPIGAIVGALVALVRWSR